MSNRNGSISINKQMVGDDPQIPIYVVSLEESPTKNPEQMGTLWRETISSREALDWFLRGVQCGASMPALYNVIFEIPK